MNSHIQDAKRVARAFLQDAYSDNHLILVLDHMRSGEFSFTSCCCFIGIPTANHKLQGRTINWSALHYVMAKERFGPAAENAAAVLGRHRHSLVVDDALLRRRLIPMILFEIRRRERVRMEERRLVESEARPILQETSTVGR